MNHQKPTLSGWDAEHLGPQRASGQHTTAPTTGACEPSSILPPLPPGPWGEENTDTSKADHTLPPAGVLWTLGQLVTRLPQGQRTEQKCVA